MAGACLGENGGVRGRGGATDGGVGGAGAASRGEGAVGVAAAGEAGARCGVNSVLGTGGGHGETDVDATGVLVLDNIGFTPLGVVPRAGAASGALPDAGRSSPQFTDAPTGMRPPHTEHRARIDTLVILAGSSRKTDRHSGQDTFIGSAGLAVSGSRAVAGPA